MAEQVDDIAFGTTKGPTRFGPLIVACRVRGGDDALWSKVRRSP